MTEHWLRCYVVGRQTRPTTERGACRYIVGTWDTPNDQVLGVSLRSRKQGCQELHQSDGTVVFAVLEDCLVGFGRLQAFLHYRKPFATSHVMQLLASLVGRPGTPSDWALGVALRDRDWAVGVCINRRAILCIYQEFSVIWSISSCELRIKKLFSVAVQQLPEAFDLPSPTAELLLGLQPSLCMPSLQSRGRALREAPLGLLHSWAVSALQPVAVTIRELSKPTSNHRDWPVPPLLRSADLPAPGDLALEF